MNSNADASVEAFVSLKAHLEKKYHSKQHLEMIASISSKFSLNTEQDHAFHIIANHVFRPIENVWAVWEKVKCSVQCLNSFINVMNSTDAWSLLLQVQPQLYFKD